MASRKILIRHLGADAKPWALYWTGTEELATDETFATLDDAGWAARRLMGGSDPAVVDIATHPGYGASGRAGAGLEAVPAGSNPPRAQEPAWPSGCHPGDDSSD